MYFREKIKLFSKQYHQLINNPDLAERIKMPGKTYFISNNYILSIPRDDGECRFPYGKNGFNFWAYSSGYMHCNEGLFSPFIRATEGQESKIAFFTGFQKDKDGYNVIPVLSVPKQNTDKKVERYTIFTPVSVYYIAEIEGLIYAVRVFVGKENKMYFTLTVENQSNEYKKIFVSSYMNPFLKNALVENSVDRWFREVNYIENEDKKLGDFLIKVYEEKDRSSMKCNYGIISRVVCENENSKFLKHEETTSRYQYVGGCRNSLYNVTALTNGTFGQNPKHTCTFTETAIMGDINHIELDKDGYIRFDYCLSYCFNEKEKNQIITNKLTARIVDEELEKIIDEERIDDDLTFKFNKSTSLIKEQVFNSFLEYLKKQVEFCSVIKGYVQLSSFSLIGIRDIYQALEGLMFWKPEIAREKMLESLNFISPDGRCPRQYSLPSYEAHVPEMDLRPFIDQGVWVISTIVTYLRLTQDFKFLNEQCGYYKFIDDKLHKIEKLDKTSTVLQHMLEIMEYLLTNRDRDYTKCVCALYGDWNDALDGLGKSQDPKKEYGTGVSVMVTLQVYQNLFEMIELLKRLNENKYKKYIKKYEKTIKEIEEGLNKYAVIENQNGEKKIVHGWGDKRSYLVGSFNDPDNVSRDGLTSNAFWVISGMYDKDMSIGQAILDAFNRLDSKYGIKTFEPYFKKGTKGVGRIPNLPAGTAENGAVYIHATAFAIMALFRMGQPKLAWEQLEKILPFTHDKISCSPYVMPNSYGFNKDKNIDGESMQDWQTGSSNVVLKLIIRFVIGIEPQFDGVWVQPSGWLPFEGFETEILIRNCKIRIKYTKEKIVKRKFIVNGIEKEGIYDKVMKLNKLWLNNEELNAEKLDIEVID